MLRSNGLEQIVTQNIVPRLDAAAGRAPYSRTVRAGLLKAGPAPRVSERHHRQNGKIGGFRTTIRDREAYGKIICALFGILDLHIEKAILIEDARIQQFVLALLPATAFICCA